jgi:hypothetical protein
MKFFTKTLAILSRLGIVAVMEPARPILIQPKELVPWHHWYELKDGKFSVISPAEFTKRTGIDAFYILSVPVGDMCQGWEPQTFRNCWYVAGENSKKCWKRCVTSGSSLVKWNQTGKKRRSKSEMVKVKSAIPFQVNGMTIGSISVPPDWGRGRIRRSALSIAAGYGVTEKIKKVVVVPGKLVNIII